MWRLELFLFHMQLLQLFILNPNAALFVLEGVLVSRLYHRAINCSSDDKCQAHLLSRAGRTSAALFHVVEELFRVL